MPDTGLTVAVTGPTGTFGSGLLPLLQADQRIERIVGIARGPFDPAEHGWTKMTYRQGDVADPDALAETFAGADVVVHLAFAVTGAASPDTLRTINVDGTLNAVHAAVAAGASRFVYASSVAAYGFFSDNPIGMDESWPVRPADRLFYAREKAEIEQRLRDTDLGGMQLYVLRPSFVVGPHAVGAKALLGAVPGLSRLAGNGGALPRLPVPLPLPVPALPLQVVHEDDVGAALLLCTVAAGPPGAYNIAADGIVTAADVTRLFGFLPLALPPVVGQVAARLGARLPLLPPALQWVEAAAHPAIMDTSRAKAQLGWTPAHTALDALQDTLVDRA
jgi:nucleoside-diphosphate-sugar epimerase